MAFVVNESLENSHFAIQRDWEAFKTKHVNILVAVLIARKLHGWSYMLPRLPKEFEVSEESGAPSARRGLEPMEASFGSPFRTSDFWLFSEIGSPFGVGVLVIRALLSWACVQTPDSWQLPHLAFETASSQPRAVLRRQGVPPASPKKGIVYSII